MTGRQALDSLAQMGYFNYADPEHLSELRATLEEMLGRHGVLSSVWDTVPPYQPMCYRYYRCDGEDLFEEGGLVEELRLIEPTLNKMGFKLLWSDEHFKDDATVHTIKLNAKEYDAFRGDPSGPDIWGRSTRNFVTMVNDQLAIGGYADRLYPIMGGNDGNVVFLTDEQFQFIKRNFPGKERPMEINEWWMAMGGE